MIRVLTERDLDEFIRIREESLSTNPEAFGSSAQEGVDRQMAARRLEARNEEYFTLGHFEGERLTGIIGFIREKGLKKRHRAWIWGMYVSPGDRGSGIAGLLLAELIRKARRLEGLEQILLSVSSGAPAALRFYQKAGFTEWGRHPDAFRLDGRYLDEIHMLKRLST